MKKLQIVKLDKNTWKDFETLFGARGACGGCWCMYWRIRRKEFEKNKGSGNHAMMQKIVSSGEMPGLLAFDGSKPVGWCSIAKRDRFPVLDNSRVLKRVDDKDVWSIVCFYIRKNYRNLGVATKLVKGAIEYVREQGGGIIEGYPIDKKDRTPDVFAYTGTLPMFTGLKFKEVERRSETRPIMRKSVFPPRMCMH